MMSLFLRCSKFRQNLYLKDLKTELNYKNVAKHNDKCNRALQQYRKRQNSRSFEFIQKEIEYNVIAISKNI